MTLASMICYITIKKFGVGKILVFNTLLLLSWLVKANLLKSYLNLLLLFFWD